MTMKQRGRIYGSAIAIPGNARIQDGDSTLLADVVARPDGVNALCVDTEMTFYSDNVTINNIKNAVYLATLTTKTAGKPEFHQLSQWGSHLVSDLDISQATLSYTWNTDGTVATSISVIQGKTFTRTYTWNTDGTLQTSIMAVS